MQILVNKLIDVYSVSETENNVMYTHIMPYYKCGTGYT